MAKFQQGNVLISTNKKLILGDNSECEISYDIISGKIKLDPSPIIVIDSLSDINDVNITSQSVNEVLMYDGSSWINRELSKIDVGLDNVINLDFTNASNITTGTLPTSVLPNLSISSTHTAINETAQLALIVEKGDVCVRLDDGKSYILSADTNNSMSDWQELVSPTNLVSSVNSKVGTIILTQDDIGDGSIYVNTNNNLTNALKIKLEGIDPGANVNLTPSELKTAYESNFNTNVFTDAEKLKLFNTNELTNGQIKIAYETNINTNAFTDDEKIKLAGIEPGATIDQPAVEIKTSYESNLDTNVFTDGEKAKLGTIETNATGDMTNLEIKSAYEINSNTNAFTDTEKLKLSTVSENAKDNMTNDAIKIAYESNLDTNAFTDAEKLKVAGFVSMTNLGIKTAYESNSNTNAFTNDLKSKLILLDDGAVGADPGVGVQSFTEFTSMLFRLSVLESGSYYGAFNSMIETVDFQHDIVGGCYCSFMVPDGFDDTKDVIIRFLYSLNGSDDGHVVRLVTNVSSILAGSSDLNTLSYTDNIIAGSNNSGKMDMFIGTAKITSTQIAGLNRFITIHHTREAGNASDTYLGTYQLIAIHCYQN